MKIITTITTALAVFIHSNAEDQVRNRLAEEQSPYLQQHAHNPVNWFPWGEEAFKKAKAEDKPIFLSIGYSTCHWCHVMEKESFEDREVAELLNAAFINIKVDREERPDIDTVYMTAAYAMNQQGGWPLNVILTPDKKPFFAATYIPKYSKYGIVGLTELIPAVQQGWKTNRTKIIESAQQLYNALNTSKALIPALISPTVSEEAFQALLKQFDSKYGGFGTGTKFPTTQNLRFLLNFAENSSNKQAIEATAMLSKTLQAMRFSGIYDQIGHGFHRYATDPTWKIPHFEKMLYDNAALMLTYAEAASSSLFPETERAFYTQTVQDIFTYLSRDMLDPSGAFYAAEDADSEGEEGKFYLWPPDELKQVLQDEYRLIEHYYDLEMMVEHGRQTGTYILILKELPTSQEQQKLNKVLNRLYDVREKRVHPFKDKKILCDWNGFTIAALATASRKNQNRQFINTAKKAAAFCFKNLFNPKQRQLYHLSMNGYASIQGKLDDYAYLSWGFTELYLTTGDPQYLKNALILMTLIQEKFIDHNGVIYMTEKNDELIFRPQSHSDNAIPSGGAVTLNLLDKLGRLTGDSKLSDLADKILSTYSPEINRFPTAYMTKLTAVEARKRPHKQIIAVTNQIDEAAITELKALYQKLDRSTTLTIKTTANQKLLGELIPFSLNLPFAEHSIVYYLCHENRCSAPAYSLGDLEKQLTP